MEMRSLGKTGLQVSRIGLGLAALGRPGYINLGHAADLRSDFGVAAMEARAHAVLDGGAIFGIRYFDAARSYGQAEVLRHALAVEIDGERLFDCVQATWNLLEPSAGSILQEAHEAGLGVIVKEALANGRLTERNRDANFAPKRKILEQQAACLGA